MKKSSGFSSSFTISSGSSSSEKERARESTELRGVKRKIGDLEEHMQEGRRPAKVAKTSSVEIIEPEDPEVLVISPIPPAPAPPVLTSPDLAAPAPSARAPPVAPAPIAAQAPPAAISNKEIDDLVGNLCQMFQETDPL